MASPALCARRLPATLNCYHETIAAASLCPSAFDIWEEISYLQRHNPWSNQSFTFCNVRKSTLAGRL